MKIFFLFAWIALFKCCWMQVDCQDNPIRVGVDDHDKQVQDLLSILLGVGLPATPQDCAWTTWIAGDKCEEISPKKYGIKRTRSKIPAKNGGKDCTGPSEEYEDCDEQRYAATTFAASFANAILGNVGGSSSCAKDFFDSKGNIQLVGNCPTGRKKRDAYVRAKRQTTLSNKQRDVLFLIDESGSVGTVWFQKFLELAKEMARTFCGGAISISSTQTRIGAVTWAGEQKLHIRFDDSFDRETIMENIFKIPYRGGTTCMINSLRYARSSVFTRSNGARVDNQGVSNPGNEKFIILLTDGCANCQRSSNVAQIFEDEGDELEKAGISVYTVLIGGTDHCVRYVRSLNKASSCFTVSRQDIDAHIAVFKRIPCLGAWNFGNPCS